MADVSAVNYFAYLHLLLQDVLGLLGVLYSMDELFQFILISCSVELHVYLFVYHMFNCLCKPFFIGTICYNFP